ncbi:hypothetical protein Acsp04_10020 [Actinomadura sp. NBRC 104425]|uniref:DUF742 domain-containing protein n=1 Tax=Actinomadura sp. NBRC 104425 TaxID=3032204 RepID=UPI0024A30792|nr:DUF742 domain-containing protein [Actinomadura sp. NBRC 104425]GLZ10767.1 hypothetical protein Acsp04_10020 [Actinomadura sp. NBRC 104425]
MAVSGQEPWLDGNAGRLVRPYQVSGGRTRPAHPLNLLSLVKATGREAAPRHGPEHARILELCRRAPVPVAELAAHLRLPVAVTKVLVADLIDHGAVQTRHPGAATDPSDPIVLEALLDGLRQRL